MIDINNIPKHWEVKKLGEVCEVIMGQSPLSETYNRNKLGLPFFQGKTEFTELNPIPRVWCTKPKKIAEIGDILLSVRAPVGAVNIANQKCSIGRGLAIIRYPQCVNFIYYFLKSIEQELDKKGTGTTFRAVSGDTIKNFEISLPPLPEQQQIVAKIEELFTELENGKQKLLLAKQQLETYKQSLFQNLLAIETNKTIEEITENIDQGWSPKCYNESSKNINEWAVIKTTAVQSGAFEDWQNKILPTNLKVKEQYEIKVDDLLITRAGPRIRVGICCLVKKTRPKLLLCDKVYRLRINKKFAKPEYIEAILNSPKYSKEIEKMKSGISDSGVNLTQAAFKKIKIPIPSLPIQERLVNKLSGCYSVCKNFDEKLEVGLQNIETLKQSILQQAFVGKLIKPIGKLVNISDEKYKPKNMYIYQCQILGAIIRASNNKNIQHGEMTLAKMAYLIDKVFQIPTYYDYKQWHLGPYAPAMKIVINKAQFFDKSGGTLIIKDEQKLFKYDNPNIALTENAINELMDIFVQFDTDKRSHKIELFSTICKVVEDTKTTLLSNIRKAMQDWKIDTTKTKDKFKNKAEKFSEEETEKTLAFLISKGWDIKLMENLQ